MKKLEIVKKELEKRFFEFEFEQYNLRIEKDNIIFFDIEAISIVKNIITIMNIVFNITTLDVIELNNLYIITFTVNN